MTPSDQVFVLEEEGRAESAGLHQGAVVDVVLVQGPLWPGGQAEVVGAQPYYNPRRTCFGFFDMVKVLSCVHTEIVKVSPTTPSLC